MSERMHIRLDPSNNKTGKDHRVLLVLADGTEIDLSPMVTGYSYVARVDEITRCTVTFMFPHVFAPATEEAAP